MRWVKYPVVYPFVESSKLLIQKGMAGATGNVYTGLHEFDDMAFTLHVLRENDLFADIGANIGSYTVLASANARSNTVCVEPIPATWLRLKHNIAVNDIESKVTAHNCGVGEQRSQLLFTKSNDSLNHVVTKTDPEEPSITVDVYCLDELFSGQKPLLMKIDVEGFELAALRGADSILKSGELKCLIVELNGSCRRYGVTEDQIHNHLLSYGFGIYSYNAFDRTLAKLITYNSNGNTIYVRDFCLIDQRLKSSRKYSILNQEI